MSQIAIALFAKAIGIGMIWSPKPAQNVWRRSTQHIPTKNIVLLHVGRLPQSYAITAEALKKTLTKRDMPLASGP